MAKTLDPQSLVPLDIFPENFPLRIELAYAAPGNLLLGEAIYRPGARLWLYEDLAAIVLLAAKRLGKQGLRLVVYDGLRTIEAQQKMIETARVHQNPHWLEEPRLLSSPGGGGHPRGMAADVAAETPDGILLDMGTAFDYLAENAAAEYNPAHRQHPHLSKQVNTNRKILDEAMTGAARALGLALQPLPEEWWDFRQPPEIFNQYAPLSDAGLPPQMRMTDAVNAKTAADFPAEHFEKLRAGLLARLGGL